MQVLNYYDEINQMFTLKCEKLYPPKSNTFLCAIKENYS
jgi:hypothetical protein